MMFSRVLVVGIVLVALLLLAPAASASPDPWFVTSNTALAADYHGEIVVLGSSLTLDCAGYRVLGDGSGVGVNVIGDSVLVKHCDVEGFDTGILAGGRGSQILENTARHDGQGISLALTSDSTVSGNRADDNSLWGIIAPPGSNNNVITGNTANGNRFIGIALNTTTGNLVTGNAANNNGDTGVDSLFATNNRLVGNVAMHNGNSGFAFSFSSGNEVTRNSATNNGTPGNGTGFNLNTSSANVFSGNTAIHSGGVGFYAFFDSSLNTFIGNRACQSYFVDAADASTGAGNTWTNNNFCTTEGI
jgi:parallel beta-helix repeat protein